MQIILKVELLEPVLESDSNVRLGALRINKELWNPIEADSAKVAVDSLLEIAAENIVKHRSADKLVLVSVEAPGLRVVLGENLLRGSSTVLSPKPSYLRRVLFVKYKNGKCEVVHEFRPKSQLLVYEGSIELIQNIDYDFIIFECEDYKRVLLPHELLLSVVKSEVRKAKKTRRKKKRSKIRFRKKSRR